MRWRKDYAEYEEKSAAELLQYQNIFNETDQSWRSSAKKMFDTCENLTEAIKEKVYPCIRSIKTDYGGGIGFFQHDQWLVSNAHVVPTREALHTANTIDCQKNRMPMNVERSFHRPDTSEKAPDVVIIKIRGGVSKKLDYCFNGDKAYSETHLFTIVNDSVGGFEIKLLKQVSKSKKLPLKYQFMDGSIPKRGSSGAPILEARVTQSRIPQWQFRVVGILYARCNVPHNIGSKLLCAIPVTQEFSQIQDVLNKERTAERYRQMSLASQVYTDTKGKKDAVKYQQRSELTSVLAEYSFLDFEIGKTNLNIMLPDGLEPLGGTIAKLRASLLIKSNQKKLPRKKNFSHTTDLGTLRSDFNDFLKKIAEVDEVKWNKKQDRVYESPDTLFRMDIIGGKGSGWMLEIQDNTGKFTIDGRSTSQIFARVKITNGNCNCMKGTRLSGLFRESQNDQEVKEINNTISTKSKGQKTSKRKKHNLLKTSPPKERKRDKSINRKECKPDLALDRIREILKSDVMPFADEENDETDLFFTSPDIKNKFVDLLLQSGLSVTVLDDSDIQTMTISTESYKALVGEAEEKNKMGYGGKSVF